MLFYNLIFHLILKINLKFGISGEIYGKGFVHLSNQHSITESRHNLNIGLFISRKDNSINEQNQFSINEFISPLTTGTLGRLCL